MIPRLERDFSVLNHCRTKRLIFASHESGRAPLLLPAAENERTVRSPKTKGVGERHIQGGGLGLVGGVVEVADWIGVIKVGGGRNDLALQGHDGDAGLQAA